MYLKTTLQKIKERNDAKNKGDFALADKIRSELLSKGILIEDQKEKLFGNINDKRKKYIYLTLL